MRILSTLLLLAFINSCSFEMVKATSASGKVVRFKQYKDDEKDEKYHLKNQFKYLVQVNETTKYQRAIHFDTLNSNSVFLFDSISVHLGNPDSNYAVLFMNGLFDPQYIYEKLVEPSFNLVNWEKNCITIAEVNRLNEIETKNNKMRFEILTYLGLCPCHGPFQKTFYLEITNENMPKSGDLNEFIKSAEISGFGGW